jgi:hypothetical protein
MGRIEIIGGQKIFGPLDIGPKAWPVSVHVISHIDIHEAGMSIAMSMSMLAATSVAMSHS